MKNTENIIDIHDNSSLIARHVSKKIALLIMVFAIITTLIHVWFNSVGLLTVVKKNALHLGLMLGLCFLIFPISKSEKSKNSNPTTLDWILCCGGVFSGIYLMTQYDRFIRSAAQGITTDYIVAIFTILLILEAARRAVGLVLPLMAISFIFYTKYGQLFPGLFAHQGFTWKRILIRMYMTDNGIYGITLAVSATYVFMFVLFGAFLGKSGTAQFFNEFAMALAGKYRGGPAKVAVFASGLMGSISGSSQANVATTGAFTIPLMKKVGYSPRFAGAVEAAASTGGILMPPIMGASAFIMSSFLGISYMKVVYAGIIPAMLYYFAVFMMVDTQSVKLKLKGVEKDQLPDLKTVIKERGHLVTPLIVIIVLLMRGLTPLYAAFFGLLSVIVVSSLRKNTRMSLRTIISALEEGALSAVPIAIACGVVGFVVGSVSMTSLGQVVASNILLLSFGKLWIALILVMISAIILGMGLPSTACYIITVTIAAPALINMGVTPIAAHFFAFYFGTFSAVVPPVALTSYTAAGLSGAKPMEVAFTGFKIASAGLIIPYVFVYAPSFLFAGDIHPIIFPINIITIVMGIVLLAYTNQNYAFTKINFFERVLLFASAICLASPNLPSDIFGIVVGGIIVIRNYTAYKRGYSDTDGLNVVHEIDDIPGPPKE